VGIQDFLHGAQFLDAAGKQFFGFLLGFNVGGIVGGDIL